MQVVSSQYCLQLTSFEASSGKPTRFQGSNIKQHMSHTVSYLSLSKLKLANKKSQTHKG